MLIQLSGRIWYNKMLRNKFRNATDFILNG